VFESPFLLELLSLLLLEEELEEESLPPEDPESLLPEEPELLSLPDTFFFLPLLKSVSYQPLPFKRKAAAETSLLSLGSPQDGQSVSGASFSFCNFSNLWSQAWHWYS